MIDRRTLLKLLAAGAAAQALPLQANASAKRVVVAGAGIVGASIAYHLAKAGVQVTIVDTVGPASHASKGTFAWINATWAKQPRSYHTFNQQSVADWATLSEELDIPVHWGGSIEWFESAERQQKLAEQIDEQIQWGEPARMVPPKDFASLEPKVNFQGASAVALSPNDGAVDPVLATQKLLAAAEAVGAVLISPCKVLNVVSKAGRMTGVVTSEGTITADKLILATGADPEATKQLAGIDIPQRSTPGVIAITKPMPPLMKHIVVAPGIHMHQRLDGRIVLGEQDGAPQNAAHAVRLKKRPTTFPNRAFAQQHFDRIMIIAKKFLPEIAGAEVDGVHIGWRPLPLDGHPVLGATAAQPDVYMAIMHSGVSLAPLVGQLVAREIANDVALPNLAAYRPDRNFKNIKRY